MRKVPLGRMEGFTEQSLPNLCLTASPRSLQVVLSLSTCSNLFWLVRAAWGKC